MPRIFISYRKSDSRVAALTLYARLEARLGADRVFMDEFGIQPGDHWLAKLKRELIRSDAQLVLIGPEWLDAKDANGQLRLGAPDDVVTLEIVAAFERGAAIIPVLLNGAQLPETDKLPPELARLTSRQCFTVGEAENDEGLDYLISVLEGLPERIPETVGGYFYLVGHVGQTRHTDIFQAVPESDQRSFDTFAVHLLRRDGDDEVRNWFQYRCLLWQRVVHAHVVDQHSKSDFSASALSPFYVVSTRVGGHTLDSEIKSNGGLERNRIVDILNVASDICESAHQKEVLLQSLEPLHFGVDPGGELCYEGFDAAVDLGSKTGYKQKNVEKYCIAPEHLAPEVGTRKASWTVDIYALGMLLKSMEMKPGYALERLQGDERYDRWSVFIFHCLSIDPRGRFQNLPQFRRFLKWCLGEELLPKLVVLDSESNANSENKCFIGRTPVTNFEYEQFCVETQYPLYAPDPNSRRVAERLQGPLCPVVNVNLNDAEKYCKWLSEKTRANFRLPTEAEWIQAARGSEEGLHRNRHEAAVVNCGNRFGGPIVVEAFIDTRSDIGCWDMLGNVWEWCGDWKEQDLGQRVLKGGSYSCVESKLTCTERQTAVRTCRASNIGFRVLKEG